MKILHLTPKNFWGWAYGWFVKFAESVDAPIPERGDNFCPIFQVGILYYMAENGWLTKLRILRPGLLLASAMYMGLSLWMFPHYTAHYYWVLSAKLFGASVLGAILYERFVTRLYLVIDELGSIYSFKIGFMLGYILLVPISIWVVSGILVLCEILLLLYKKNILHDDIGELVTKIYLTAVIVPLLSFIIGAIRDPIAGLLLLCMILAMALVVAVIYGVIQLFTRVSPFNRVTHFAGRNITWLYKHLCPGFVKET